MDKGKIIVILLIVTAIIISSFFIIGLVNNHVQKSKVLLIGVSQPNLTDPWQVVMNQEIIEEIEKHDVRVIFTDAVQNPEKQLQDIDKLMDYGIDLLIVSMSDAEVMTPKVAQVYSQIPVIVLDRDVLGYDYTLFIGLDNNLIGETAGNYVLDYYGAKKTKIIELTGDNESPSTFGRADGFRNVISKYDNLELLTSIECNWKRDIAQDNIEDYLQSGSELPDVIYAHSDDMAYGAYLAIQEHGITNIDIIGMDALEGELGGLNLLKEGIIDCTYTCPTGGKEAIRYAIEILNNEQTIPKKIILRSYEITKDSIDSFYVYNDTVYTDLEHIKVGFAQVGSESAWRNANTKSIINAGQHFGIDLDFRNVDNNLSDEDKQQKQIEHIESFIDSGVDVIAFSPIVETGFEEVLAKAKEAGIPVILCDREVTADVELWTTFIGSDFVEEGRRAARWLMEQELDENKIDIIELQGTKGAAPSIGRQEGFLEVISNDDRYNIIYSVVADFNKVNGNMAMVNILEEFDSDIDVVYAHNDDMALGAIEAIEEYGLIPGKDIIVISVDATSEAFEALIEGQLNCAVECNPLLGPQIMKTAQQLAQGYEVPIRIITREGVYTADNARQFIGEREY